MQRFKIYSPQYQTFFWVVATAILTTVFSQVHFIPFHEGHLRFGLGPVIFLLLLLIHRIPAIPTACLIAVSIVVSRASFLIFLEDIPIIEAIIHSIPSGIYYLFFGICLHFIPFDRLQQQPLFIGLLVSAVDISSNIIEHFIGYLMLADPKLTISQILMIVVICSGRAFAVLGIYSATVIHTQQKKIEEMLSLDSSLYVESLYLQKAMNEIEQLTGKSYDMYRLLQDKQLGAESRQALLLAQGIHEVKKDTERIFAGITKMMMHKEHTHYTLHDMLHFVSTANQQHAILLSKDIAIRTTSNKNMTMLRITPMMAILNNLLSNAIEAISDCGTITLDVVISPDMTTFTVTDNGPGIAEDVQAIMFEPGFTTKFSTEGVASTGIGLSHVTEILHRLEGQIFVTSRAGSTQFKIIIPTLYIKKEE